MRPQISAPAFHLEALHPPPAVPWFQNSSSESFRDPDKSSSHEAGVAGHTSIPLAVCLPGNQPVTEHEKPPPQAPAPGAPPAPGTLRAQRLMLAQSRRGNQPPAGIPLPAKILPLPPPIPIPACSTPQKRSSMISPPIQRSPKPRRRHGKWRTTSTTASKISSKMLRRRHQRPSSKLAKAPGGPPITL